jgi:hypothetical protein
MNSLKPTANVVGLIPFRASLPDVNRVAAVSR